MPWQTIGKERFKTVFDKISRTKTVSESSNTRLRPCWTAFDVTFFGIGNMVGAGLYMQTGKVIMKTTGPAVFLSYIVAGIAIFLSASCYAELESRMPSAGSAYTFSYKVVGELCGFLLGWNLLLKNMLGAAALATAWSQSFDYLIDKAISNLTMAYVGVIPDARIINGAIHMPDFLAATLIVAISSLVCLGSRRSANFNTAFAMLNLSVIVFVISYGTYLGVKDGILWNRPDSCKPCEVSKNGTVTACNTGSAFLPFGPFSVVTGASEVFFAYVGFNFIASAGEETKSPHCALPRGTMISVTIVFAAYISMSAVLALLVPYCEISLEAPFPHAFLTLTNNKLIYYFISIGGLSAMTTVLFGNLFVLPRSVYSMACDGILPEIFKRLTSTQVPFVPIVLFGSVSAIFALCVNLESLMATNSLGMLIDYSVVACCVSLLRYRKDSSKIGGKRPSIDMTNSQNTGQLKPRFLFIWKVLPYTSVPFLISSLIPTLLGLSAIVILGYSFRSSWLFITGVIILTALSFFIVFLIYAHYASEATLYFKVPFVPFVPTLGLLFNTMLMMNVKRNAWIQYFLWQLLGVAIYLSYGIRHSKENKDAPTLTQQQTLPATTAASTELSIWQTPEALTPKSPYVMVNCNI